MTYVVNYQEATSMPWRDGIDLIGLDQWPEEVQDFAQAPMQQDMAPVVVPDSVSALRNVINNNLKGSVN